MELTPHETVFTTWPPEETFAASGKVPLISSE